MRALSLLVLLTACNPEAQELADELCASLSGEAEAADLAAQPGQGPDLVADGRAYRLAMPNADLGYATFTPDSAGPVVIGFAESATVAVYGEVGQIRSQATVQGGCEGLAVRHTWDMAVEEHIVELAGAETYVLALLPSGVDL